MMWVFVVCFGGAEGSSAGEIFPGVPTHPVHACPAGRSGVVDAGVNLGSDELLRPDNEDGPEFKENLPTGYRLVMHHCRRGGRTPTLPSCHVSRLSARNASRRGCRMSWTRATARRTL